MRVMQLISSAGFYGAENVTLELTAALNRQHVFCLLGAFQNLHKPNLEIVDVAKQRSLPFHVFNCRGQVDPLALLAIRRAIREYAIDIVHSHEAKSNVYSLFAGLGTQARRVATCHNWTGSGKKIRLYNRVDKSILKYFSRVAAVSEEVRDESLESGVRRSKVAVVSNGVRLARFVANADTKQRLAADFGIPSGYRVVGTVSRLSQDKNIEQILRAFAAITTQRTKTLLLIVGDGPHRASLETEVERLGIKDHVRFAGKRSDIPAILDLLDVFVMTSVNEGLPMVLLEAMAAKRPVVTTAVGAIPTVVVDGESGLLVPTGDAPSVTASILRLLADDTHARELGERAFQVVKERYSTERMARDYVHLYQEALAR